ncbi:DHH family phosphoesterase [Candidatus Woesearchaeota archaeon]|jgi:single-stranded-DNA-specific exonuclease|nr:DHH family phosphoesterase [Candidatus Woesearchaeota archaeon]MBT6519532.1 DHH family phosphoesterase [Candidatus Woesearchaeota archaeon]MBT7367723.1 DHH family phosphoesterase [Candidatus Woesearchaeota archaeon]
MKSSQFFSFLEKSANKFNDLFKDVSKFNSVKLISHLDTDGITAASIFIKSLERANIIHSVSIVPTLDSETIESLCKDDADVFVFTDLGSGQISLIQERITDKPVFILDHHTLEETKINKNITHVNPHLFDIDGGTQISGSGVVYFFCKALNPINKDLAHLAIIGAIGDVQESRGFKPLNKLILDEAITNKKIKVTNSLRLFGIETRPLHKVLEFSSDPFIPGVSGSESGSIQFLQEIGIEPKKNDTGHEYNYNNWKKMSDLNKEEIKKLHSAIIMKRMEEKNPEDIFGPVYSLIDEKPETPFRDIREFSTLLNSCGRMGNSSLGIGVCLDNPKIKKKALRNLTQYRKQIINALEWFHANRGTSRIIEGDGYVIINAKENILHTIIGTLASILSKGKFFPEGTLILSLARNSNELTKVSLRVTSLKPMFDIDLRKVINKITVSVGGESGGHQYASGAVIETIKENVFIDAAKKVLSNGFEN